MNGRGKLTILRQEKSGNNIYEGRRFVIPNIQANKTFMYILEIMRLTGMYTTNTDKYTNELEMSIYTIKDQVRCTMYELLYKYITWLMTTKVVE